jgi:peptidoglycan/LPS O-acetylase OafA/YrhL
MNRETHLDFLDVVRGAAILGVFVFHCVSAAFGVGELPWSGWHRSIDVPWALLLASPLMYGSLGVAVFFAVSGFCIHLSFVRTPDWRAFTVRRFFRIYPPYFAALLIFALVYPLSRLPFSSLSDYANLGSHLLLAHNLDSRSFFAINASFWSIGVEVQLYALYPLMVVAGMRFGWKRTLAVLVTIEVAIRAIMAGFDPTGHSLQMPIVGWPLTCLASWAVGACVAEAWVKQQPLPFAGWPLSAMLLLAFGSIWMKPTSVLAFPLFSLLATVIIVRRLERGRTTSSSPNRLANHLRSAGLCSYSLYLIHQPLVKTVAFALPASMPVARLAIACASWFVILPLAKLLYVWCEMPSAALGKQLGRAVRMPAPPLPSTAA